MFPFPHYHDEALGWFSGTATIRLGGANGIEQTVQLGNMVLIPSGVGHENLGSNGNFTMVRGLSSRPKS